MEYASRVVFAACSLELGDAVGTPALEWGLGMVGVVGVDKVNKIPVSPQNRTLRPHRVGDGDSDLLVVAGVAVSHRDQHHGVVGPARLEAEHVGTVSDRLGLRQEFDEDAVHIRDGLDRRLPDLDEFDIHSGGWVLERPIKLESTGQNGRELVGLGFGGRQVNTWR